MLNGLTDVACRRKLAQELERNPGFIAVLSEIRDASETYSLDPRLEGLEIAPREGRCRMKLFRPREEKDRLCAFFFKKSNIAGSRDRFSYGAVEFLPERVTPEEIQSWLTWLSSGLDPERRPAHLKRAFLYTIPE